MASVQAVFAGPKGVRAGWKVLLFALAWLVLGGGLQWLLLASGAASRDAPFWDLRNSLLGEASALATVVAVTFAAVRLEGRSLADYGFARPGAGLLATGTVWGLLAVGLLVAALRAFGAWVPVGLHAAGPALAVTGAAWLIFFVFLGFAEEMLFRGYGLFVLGRSVGWPIASILLSLVFAAAHAGKAGENWMDLMNVFIVGLFLCFTILRTGSLWFAIGFHFAWDFAALWIASGPNAGQQLPGRLLDVTVHGPAWLSGGQLGPEASALMWPLFALVFVLFGWKYRWGRHLQSWERDRQVSASGPVREEPARPWR